METDEVKEEAKKKLEAEEKAKEEADKKVKEEVDKPLSIVEEAKLIRDEIVKAKEELKAENERQEKIRAESLLGSSAGGHIEPKKAEPLTDVQYAEALERGEVNPLKEDGFIK